MDEAGKAYWRASSEAAKAEKARNAQYWHDRAEWVKANSVRTDLTAGQHILHLLLSVVTCGLWIPVWMIRAVQGNKTVPPAPPQAAPWPPAQYPYPPARM